MAEGKEVKKTPGPWRRIQCATRLARSRPETKMPEESKTEQEACQNLHGLAAQAEREGERCFTSSLQGELRKRTD